MKKILKGSHRGLWTNDDHRRSLQTKSLKHKSPEQDTDGKKWNSFNYKGRPDRPTAQLLRF